MNLFEQLLEGLGWVFLLYIGFNIIEIINDRRKK